MRLGGTVERMPLQMGAGIACVVLSAIDAVVSWKLAGPKGATLMAALHSVVALLIVTSNPTSETIPAT